VSAGAPKGSRWLDSLARWSVRGGGGRPAAASDAGASALAAGTTRRTALRGVAGAAGLAALSGPLALVRPATAGADPTALAKCQSESFKKVYADFQACVKNPLTEFDEANELLRIYEGSKSKKPLSKKAKKTLARLRRQRSQAIKDLEFCNAVFAQERGEGEDNCHAKNKPPPSEPGSGGATKAPGCEQGYVLCGEYCCSNAYAFCQGCGTPTCCRIEGNCCPSGG
jgi:hypothetical protein